MKPNAQNGQKIVTRYRDFGVRTINQDGTEVTISEARPNIKLLVDCFSNSLRTVRPYSDIKRTLGKKNPIRYRYRYYRSGIGGAARASDLNILRILRQNNTRSRYVRARARAHCDARRNG